MASPKTVTIQPASRVRGRVRPPGDKSISHRYALLSALADGASSIHGYSTGGDCRSTLECLRGSWRRHRGSWPRRPRVRACASMVEGSAACARPPACSTPAIPAARCGCSQASWPPIRSASTMAGDASLSRRPMKRRHRAARANGRRIASTDGRPPLTITGLSAPTPIDFEPEVPSAQVKSAVLLAGLHGNGVTRVSASPRPRAIIRNGRWTRSAWRLSQMHGRQCNGGQRLSAQSLSRARRHLVGGILDGRGGVASGLRNRYRACRSQPDAHRHLDILRRMGADVSIEQEGLATRRADRNDSRSATVAWRPQRLRRTKCRASSTNCRCSRRWRPMAASCASLARRNCGSRKATASPRWPTASGAWAATSTSARRLPRPRPRSV